MELINIPGSKSSFLIENPEIKTNKAVIFLPGISGGAFSNRFQPLVIKGLSRGFAVVRINAWENPKDVAKKNLTDIRNDIKYVIEYLNQHNYSLISAIGKSFGGTILITLNGEMENIEKQVLWSPVIGIRDQGSNIDIYMTTTLSSLDTLQDMYIDNTYAKNKKIKTLIVHGDADENISISNSEKLVSMLPNAELFPIKDANHSFSDKQHEEILLQKTFDFLNL
jgi:dipeptidyl aminopeptidase/acylaminoacyl peptidase